MHEVRGTRRTLFYFCNVGWFFISHRLPLARAALAKGYDVHVVADIESPREIEVIENEGIVFHRVRLSRGGLNPLADLITFASVLMLFLRYRPQIVHNITIKPVLYGSLAARIAAVRAIVNAISGLGYLFIDSERAGFALRLARRIYRFAMRSDRLRLIFQNNEDMRLFIEQRLIEPRQAVLIEGSGVDLAAYTPAPEPKEPPVRIVLPARLLADKGVYEFAEAARRLKRDGVDTECILAGALDRANPAALTESQVNSLQESGAVHWIGNVADFPALLKSVHVVCLPSYREGLPKALIEACAAGRSIVATDVPGCRDVVTDGVNGLLVPPRDSHGLHRALRRLALDAALRRSMGEAGRRIAEERFDVRMVIDRTMRLYRDMTPETCGST